MNWAPFIGVVVALVAIFLFKRLFLLSEAQALRFLREGAVVVDVRSPAEFQANHLPEAVNIPGANLKEQIQRRIPDRNQVLLLHCLSGGRSGIACRQLKALGYPNAFNLGSYSRAEQIVRQVRME
jgi:phage shock protein E